MKRVIFNCSKCNSFILELKKNGDIEINPKSRKIVINKNEIKLKIICKCKTENNIKI